MFKKIKQLLCDHRYVAYLDVSPYYISVGDEYHNRKSKRYYFICTKCKKQIEVIDSWKNEKQ